MNGLSDPTNGRAAGHGGERGRGRRGDHARAQHGTASGTSGAPFLLGKVAVAMREAGRPMSAAELGDALGVGRVTARHYAGHLVDSGRARRGNRYPGVGRPEVTYAWA